MSLALYGVYYVKQIALWEVLQQSAEFMSGGNVQWGQLLRVLSDISCTGALR